MMRQLFSADLPKNETETGLALDIEFHRVLSMKTIQSYSINKSSNHYSQSLKRNTDGIIKTRKRVFNNFFCARKIRKERRRGKLIRTI